MNKIFTLFFCMLLIFNLEGCGCSKAKKIKDEAKTKVEKVKDGAKKEVKEFFPEGQKETGNGKVFVSTPAGTSENGNVPVLYVKDEGEAQVGLTTEKLDGSKLSYIYINKTFLSKEQLGNSEMKLNLARARLQPGVYTVTVVQYENNDMNGKITEYHEAKYEIKKS